MHKIYLMKNVNEMNREEVMSYFDNELNSLLVLTKKLGGKNPRIGSTSWSFGIFTDSVKFSGCTDMVPFLTWSEAESIIKDKLSYEKTN
jgi:hypothetical protein